MWWALAEKKSIAIALCIASVAASLFFVSLLRKKNEFASQLARWGVAMPAGREFSVAAFRRSSTPTLRREDLEARRKNMFLYITRTETEFPQKYIGDKRAVLESLFEQTTSPYPGVITNVIECPEKFKPKTLTIDRGTIYTLFAGERFTYGVCADDLVAYRSLYGIFDCARKGVFEVRLFTPLAEPVPGDIMRSFNC